MNNFRKIILRMLVILIICSGRLIISYDSHARMVREYNFFGFDKVNSKIEAWIGRLKTENIREEDIKSLIDVLPKLADISEYDVDKFSLILKTLGFLPAPAVEGLLEFSNDYGGFVSNLEISKGWLKHYKSGRVEFSNMQLFARRVFVEIAAWEHGIESYKLGVSALRNGPEGKGYKILGGKKLFSLYNQYNDIWFLKEKLKILPNNFDQWVELIKMSRINWDYVPINIQKDLYEEACAEINFEKWQQTPENQRYKLLYFMRASDLKKHFDFLGGKTLANLIIYYADRYSQGTGNVGTGGFMLLRHRIGVAPDIGKKWIELMKIGSIWWHEVPAEMRWEFIKKAAKERHKAHNPILLTDRELSAPFDFLGGGNLEGLRNHYSRNKMDPLKQYLIMPMFVKEYLERIGEGEFSNYKDTRVLEKWRSIPIEVKQRLVNILAKFKNKNVSELTEKDYNCKIVPEFKGESIAGLLAVYNQEPKSVYLNLFCEEGAKGIDIETRREWVSVIKEGGVRQWLTVPVVAKRIACEELASALDKQIENLGNRDFEFKVPIFSRALIGLRRAYDGDIKSLLEDIGAI